MCSFRCTSPTSTRWCWKRSKLVQAAGTSVRWVDIEHWPESKRQKNMFFFISRWCRKRTLTTTLGHPLTPSPKLARCKLSVSLLNNLSRTSMLCVLSSLITDHLFQLISLYVFFPFGIKFVFVTCVPPQGKGKRHRRHLYCPLNSLTDQHTISNNSANWTHVKKKLDLKLETLQKFVHQ